MRYLTHKVIYREPYYFVSIILSTKENALYEVWLRFDLSGVTLTPLKFINKLKESQKVDQSHLSADLTLSLLMPDHEDLNNASFCCFRKYSLNSKGDFWFEQGETFEFEITNEEI
jgi:hypothetical protein